MKEFMKTREAAVIALVLVIITFAAYWRVLGSGFINYDDDDYVYANKHIQQGITLQSLRWTFNVGYASNWHPLTWMSHMADYTLFGADPAGHHATSLILHLASTLLLFLVLRRMTGSTWKSAFVAALFALHPLHVESVAWIAERKDVLSTFFWMLTMGAYVLYTERPGIGRYFVVILMFGLGLMAKPMLISMPIILLLLDLWPLGRTKKIGMLRLLREKIPLLAMATASGIITVIAQHKEGSVISLERLSPGIRVANSLAAYVGYIGKAVLPRNLAVFYPHPGSTLPVWQVVGSAIFLAAVTILVFYYGRRRRYLIVGWLWYVITLIPVIGLVQVGKQAMADRYTYIPLIGIFVIAAWGIPDVLGERRTRHGEFICATAACLVVAMLSALTWVQVGYWRDSKTLFRHALNVTQNNFLAHLNLGSALAMDGKIDEALEEYRQAVNLRPDYVPAYIDMAVMFCERADYAQAWKEVELCRKYGGSPNPQFIRLLSEKMPEPNR